MTLPFILAVYTNKNSPLEVSDTDQRFFSNSHRSLPELQRGNRGGQINHMIKTSAANAV
jgi:hypothetical protein